MLVSATVPKARPNPQTCKDCEKPDPSMFVVKDELWRQIYGPPEFTSIGKVPEILCLACFEKRLGRPLTFDDLKPCGNTNAMMLGLFFYTRAGQPPLTVDPSFLNNY